MLRRVLNFLQTIRQGLLSTRPSHAGQAPQQVELEHFAQTLQPFFTVERDQCETEPKARVPSPARERTTEPYWTIAILKHPAQRYRDLDAMLENIKRDRFQIMETQLVPVPVQKLARQLQRKIEQKEGK